LGLDLAVGPGTYSSRPETIMRRKTSPRMCAARGNRSASACATVDLPQAMTPVMSDTPRIT
jgi:hypothetical protein